MRRQVASYIGFVAIIISATALAQEAPESAPEEQDVGPTEVVVVASGTDEVTEEVLSQARLATVSGIMSQRDRHRRSVRPERDPGMTLRVASCTDDPCFVAIGQDAQAAFLVVLNIEPSDGGYRMMAFVVDVLGQAAIASAAVNLPPDTAQFGQAMGQTMGPLVAAITPLGPTTGTINVEVEHVGAAIFLDNRRVGSSPLDPITQVPPGQHVIRVSLDNFHDFEQTVEVVSGVDVNLNVVLEPIVVERPPEIVEPERPFYKRWWFWTIVGVGVGTGVGVGLGVGLSQGEDTGPETEWGIPFPEYNPR